MKSREWALLVLNDVTIKGAYANIAMDTYHRRHPLTGQERSFAVELARGTIKAWGTLDWMLGFYLTKPLNTLSPVIANILRMGFYQIFFMEKIPVSAASNEAVELAKKYGHLGTVKLVNAILRTALREPEKIRWPSKTTDPIKYLARTYYHPIWIVKRWYEELGFSEAEKLLMINNQAPKLGIRVQTLKNTVTECCEKLKQEQFEVSRSTLAPDGLRIERHPSLASSNVLNSGSAIIQDEGAMMIAHLLSPKPGELILDACAAPGGKATHLAQLMSDRGTVVAQDIHPHKIKLISENAKKLDLKSVKPILGDATNIHLKTPKYDRILLDVPCSGLGTIGRRADTRWRKSEQQINELVLLQRKMLYSAAKALKTNGRLVYSTCTLIPEENERQVEKFLLDHPNFRLVPVSDILFSYYDSEVSYLKLWPHITQTDGFFAACFEKKEQE